MKPLALFLLLQMTSAHELLDKIEKSMKEKKMLMAKVNLEKTKRALHADTKRILDKMAGNFETKVPSHSVVKLDEALLSLESLNSRVQADLAKAKKEFEQFNQQLRAESERKVIVPDTIPLATNAELNRLWKAAFAKLDKGISSRNKSIRKIIKSVIDATNRFQDAITTISYKMAKALKMAAEITVFYLDIEASDLLTYLNHEYQKNNINLLSRAISHLSENKCFPKRKST